MPRTGAGSAGDAIPANTALAHATTIDTFVVPIDACYELAGRMRLHWRGFDGGAEARQAIAGFLDSVRRRAVPVDRET
jgi:hypothetical protein